MSRTEATLLIEAGDSEDRANYKKSSVPQKPKGHISSFAGSDCKPIVAQTAVGFRAAVFGRRALCDTTTMLHTTTAAAEDSQ